jgi:predicted small lipoprotein YifL
MLKNIFLSLILLIAACGRPTDTPPKDKLPSSVEAESSSHKNPTTAPEKPSISPEINHPFVGLLPRENIPRGCGCIFREKGSFARSLLFVSNAENPMHAWMNIDGQIQELVGPSIFGNADSKKTHAVIKSSDVIVTIDTRIIGRGYEGYSAKGTIQVTKDKKSQTFVIEGGCGC